jgi:hypothetical protein
MSLPSLKSSAVKSIAVEISISPLKYMPYLDWRCSATADARIVP